MDSLRLSLLGLVLLVTQAIANELLPDALRPDLLLVFALAMGLRVAGTRALLLAFGVGFAFDVLSGAPLGLFALLRGTACALTRVFDRGLYLRAPLPWAIYSGGYVVFDVVLMGLTLHLLTPEVALTPLELLVRTPGPAVVTALVAAPMLVLFQRLERAAARDAGWANLSGLGS